MKNKLILLILTTMLFSSCTMSNVAEVAENGVVGAFENNTDERSVTKATVIRFTDGDTFWVRLNEDEIKLRLLYVDTPEKKESGYQEACVYTQEKILENDNIVFLESDVGNKDKWGRILRVVYFNENDTFDKSLNYILYENNFAEPLIIEPNSKYKEHFN